MVKVVRVEKVHKTDLKQFQQKAGTSRLFAFSAHLESRELPITGYGLCCKDAGAFRAMVRPAPCRIHRLTHAGIIA